MIFKEKRVTGGNDKTLAIDNYDMMVKVALQIMG